MTAPTTKPDRWSTDPTFTSGSAATLPTKVDAGDAVFAQGHVPGTTFKGEYSNFMIHNHGDWLRFLREEQLGAVISSAGFDPLDSTDRLLDALNFRGRLTSALVFRDYGTSVSTATLRDLANNPDSVYTVAVGDGGDVQRFQRFGVTAGASGQTTNFRGIDFGNSRFAAIGIDAGTAKIAMSINDGASWTTPQSGTWMSTASDILYCSSGVTYPWLFCGEYSSAGRIGRAAPDLSGGLSFTNIGADQWNRAACNPSGLVVFVGSGGQIATQQVDSTIVTLRTSGTVQDLWGIAWWAARNLWVACGGQSTILTSPDGITWTPRTPPTSGQEYWRVEAAGECVVIQQTLSPHSLYLGDPTTPATWRRTFECGATSGLGIRLIQGTFYCVVGIGGRAYISGGF